MPSQGQQNKKGDGRNGDENGPRQEKREWMQCKAMRCNGRENSVADYGVLRRGFKSNLVGNLRSRQARDFCGVDITESTNKLAHETGETGTRLQGYLKYYVARSTS